MKPLRTPTWVEVEILARLVAAGVLTLKIVPQTLLCPTPYISIRLTTTGPFAPLPIPTGLMPRPWVWTETRPVDTNGPIY